MHTACTFFGPGQDLKLPHLFGLSHTFFCPGQDLKLPHWFAPTLCIGALGLHCVMGGGWELCTQRVIVKRIRDNRYRGGRQVTLN